MNRRNCSALFLALLPVLALCSRDWPDDPGDLVAEFGVPESDTFRRSMEFRSAGDRVGAWDEGEVVWTEDSPVWNRVPDLPYIVLQHEDGFRSLYRNVEPRPDLETRIPGDDWIGYAGGTAWEFQISDSLNGRIVDPASLLPAAPGGGTGKDYQVYLVRAGTEIEPTDGTVLRPGIWNLAISDFRPVEASLFWLGQIVTDIRFDSLVEKTGQILMETPRPAVFDEIYDNSGRLILRNLPLYAGRGSLELRMIDSGGRTIRRSWNLVVSGGAQ